MIALSFGIIPFFLQGKISWHHSLGPSYFVTMTVATCCVGKKTSFHRFSWHQELDELSTCKVSSDTLGVKVSHKKLGLP